MFWKHKPKKHFVLNNEDQAKALHFKKHLKSSARKQSA